jgi:hypothetical protein
MTVCMPDERQESVKQGIAPPEESKVGKQAEEKLREQLINTPEHARPDSAMGGTSDVDSPVDEAETQRALNQEES